jgi:acyl carrier protein
MMMTKAEADVRAVLSAVAKHDVSQLAVDEDLVSALGLDSLAGLRVLAGVEKKLAVRFPDERLGELRTIDRIVAAVREISGEENH